MPGKTVLVIDTDIETEQQIMAALEAAGYLVFAAQTDDVLSETALKVSPSLMFFSPSASGAKGLETCRMIHENTAFRNIPIIVLSPYDEPMDTRYTSLYGIVDILRIPVSPEELMKKTSAALQGGAGETQEIRKESPVVSEPEDLSPASGEAIFPDEEEPVAVEAVSEPARPRTGKKDWTEEPLPDATPALEPVRKKERSLLVPLLLVGIVAIIGAAFVFYKDLIFKPSAPPVAKVQPPAPKTAPETPAAAPAPQQPAAKEAETKPVPAPETKPAQQPAPAVAAKPAKPASPAAPVASVAAKTGHSVQLGAFRDAGHAEALAKKYRDKGYDAFVKKTDSKDKGTLYRVLVGKFGDRKESVRMSESIRSKEKVQAVVYSD